MANKKISQLASVLNSALTGSAVMPIVDAADSTLKKILLSQLDLRWKAKLAIEAIAQGGTGASTKSGAFDALSPMDAIGQLIYGGASGTGTKLPAGTAGQVLQSNGGAAPSWVDRGAMTGHVAMFAGSSAPTGWILCDGSAVSRTTYAALFAIIGTTYGAGDGSTTFNLPDTRGIFVRGVGTQSVGGISYAATLATKQTDAYMSHWHQTYSPTGAGGTFVWGPQGWVNNRSPTLSPTPDAVIRESLNDGTGAPRVAVETRPANIALNFVIKF